MPRSGPREVRLYWRDFNLLSHSPKRMLWMALFKQMRMYVMSYWDVRRWQLELRVNINSVSPRESPVARTVVCSKNVSDYGHKGLTAVQWTRWFYTFRKILICTSIMKIVSVFLKIWVDNCWILLHFLPAFSQFF